MRVIDAVPGSKIFVGHQGDNEATVVRFDAQPFYDLYGDGGTFTVYVQRYGETDGYPVGSPLVYAEDGYVYWTLASADVAIAGTNECQLRYAIDSTTVMSLKYDYQVQESVVMGTTVPAPMEEWAEAIIAAAAEISPMPEDMVRVPTASSLDYVIGVSDGAVKQIGLDNLRPSWLPSPITFLAKGLAQNATLYVDLIGDRSGGVKALMLIFGSTSDNRSITMLNSTASATLNKYTLTNGTDPVTIVLDSTDAESETAHCSIVNNGTYSYVYFIVFRGQITFPT